LHHILLILVIIFSTVTYLNRGRQARVITETGRSVAGIGVPWENIIVHIQNYIITIEWSPPEKDEYFDAEYQRSMRLLTDGKLEEARFILEDLAFRSPKDPNVLYNLGMVYSEFHELDIAIDTLERCVNIAPARRPE
jgi:tetratricopeptide (TPR) repeat protein